MATTAQYASTPVFGSASVDTAETSLTSPTNVQTVLTAGTNGSRIDYIEIIGTGNTAAGLINLFVYDGSTYFLWTQIPVYAITTSATIPSYRSGISSNATPDIMPLTLPNGYSLRATVTTAQSGAVRVNVYGGDF